MDNLEKVEDNLKKLLKNPKFKKYYDKSLAELEKAKDKIQNGDYFQWNKFKKMFTLFNGVEWAKDFASIFNLRKVIIYILVLGGIFGYGYFKGIKTKPIEVDLGYKEALELQVPNSDLRLYKPKNSNKLYWINKKGDKTPVTVGDLPGLKKKLRPYGIEFSPIGVLGVGTGYPDGIEGEAGVGFRFFRYWQMRLETFATQKGIYLGTSYKLDKIKMENSSVGLSYGKGWSGEDRALLYFAFEF